MRSLPPAVGGALLAAVLGLTACGDDDPTGRAAAALGRGGDLTGRIAASGSSAQGSAMTAWISGYQDVQPEMVVIYDAIGSGGGRENLLSGASPLVGSDAALDEEERAAARDVCGEGGALHLPLYISPIAVPYNLPGIEGLNMRPEVLARVFDQQVRTWDDPAIAADNPGVELPDTPITVVNRSDDSGTTENFLEYLSAAAPQAWPHQPEAAWPVPGGEAAAQTSGVIGVVQATVGAIGYADASAIGELNTVAVGVGEQFVEYSAEAAARVVDASEVVDTGTEGDLALELARDTTEGGAYPIVLVSYAIACSSYDDAATATNIADFLRYLASEEGQQLASAAAGSAPISEELRATVLESIDLIDGGTQ